MANKIKKKSPIEMIFIIFFMIIWIPVAGSLFITILALYFTGICLLTLFIVLFEADAVRGMWANFSVNARKQFYFFFPMFKPKPIQKFSGASVNQTDTSKPIQPDSVKEDLLGTKPTDQIEPSFCPSCGTAFSERVLNMKKEDVKKIVFCEYCGQEL